MDLGGARYAVESATVREIVPSTRVTRLPGAPPHIRGVMNLRGQLVTLLDLVHRVTGTPARNPDGSTIVVEAADRVLGLLVDDVHDVRALAVGPRGSEVGGPGRGLVLGAGRFDDEVVIVIDVNEVVQQTLA